MLRAFMFALIALLALTAVALAQTTSVRPPVDVTGLQTGVPCDATLGRALSTTASGSIICTDRVANSNNATTADSATTATTATTATNALNAVNASNLTGTLDAAQITGQLSNTALPSCPDPTKPIPTANGCVAGGGSGVTECPLTRAGGVVTQTRIDNPSVVFNSTPSGNIAKTPVGGVASVHYTNSVTWPSNVTFVCQGDGTFRVQGCAASDPNSQVTACSATAGAVVETTCAATVKTSDFSSNEIAVSNGNSPNGSGPGISNVSRQNVGYTQGGYNYYTFRFTYTLGSAPSGTMRTFTASPLYYADAYWQMTGPFTASASWLCDTGTWLSQ